ncbi:restriction endonuclease [Bacillus sp. FJAT-42315]|uniref:restriction endonuclease n=1 Tax=Bacillus sp. FJAT-42315 TaxID=2014077 RepID=UPI000C242313|nr:restriction endonuclease [Bacillus sp. FJAT-42315]
MNELQKEEKFKILLETLFDEYQDYNNLINFIEDNGYDFDFAKDFVEELTKYEKDIENIFKLNIFDVDIDSFNIKFNTKVLNNVKEAIQTIKELEAFDFEKLCALYIEFLGTTGKPNVTRRSHDQGIDFVGVIEKEVLTRLFVKNMSINRLYLIGQAKHYKNDKVTSKEIRELAGSLYLLKNQNFALLENPYKNLDIKAFTPIYSYFITSYYFSESAKRLCDNADIMPIDRILLGFTFGLNNSYHDSLGNFSKDLLLQELHKIDYFS